MLWTADSVYYRDVSMGAAYSGDTLIWMKKKPEGDEVWEISEIVNYDTDIKEGDTVLFMYSDGKYVSDRIEPMVEYRYQRYYKVYNGTLSYIGKYTWFQPYGRYPFTDTLLSGTISNVERKNNELHLTFGDRLYFTNIAAYYDSSKNFGTSYEVPPNCTNEFKINSGETKVYPVSNVIDGYLVGRKTLSNRITFGRETSYYPVPPPTQERNDPWFSIYMVKATKIQ